MEYELLSKIYYKNQEQYQQIYTERFNSNEAVHLDFSIKDNPAFFLQTPEMLRTIIRIQRLDKQILQISKELPQIALNQFRNRCLIDEILLSNSIEGVHSTRQELGMILEELDTDNTLRRFYGIVRKYAMLTDEQYLPLNTCQDIRNIYNELVLYEVMEEDPQDTPDGEIFRKGSVSVESPTQRQIHRGIYPEAAIISSMDKALAILGDQDIEPVFRNAVFHYLFGYIHPFYEGNGRTIRFISSYLLTQEFTPLLGYRISYTIKENINSYYTAFKTCNDKKNKGDLTPFIIMFLNIIEESIKQLHAAMENRLDKLKYYHKNLGKLSFIKTKQSDEMYYILTQAALFADYGITIKDLMKCLNLTRNPLSKRLKTIDESGFLLCNRIGSKKYYKLDLVHVDQILSTLNS